MTYTENVSDERLDVIEANECHSQVGSLATSRFRRVFNELHKAEAANAALRGKTLEEAARCAENVVPRHTECGIKIAKAIRALAAQETHPLEPEG